MAPGQLGTVLRRLRNWVAAQGAEEGTDAQLLARFSLERDQAAFTVLVQRYGRLVWRVCRHVLHHDHDAEDAFQATFLVLALKAGSIREREALASWLHGAAYRSALQIKRKAARRRAHENQVKNMPQRKSSSDLAWRELQAVLDEEVQRLPDKYRAPFVLCCLEGKSKVEAARQLGWKEGTVSGRLAEARRQLQQRLSRRGVTLSATLGAAALSQEAVAAVPPALSSATVQTVLAVAAGQAPAAGIISANVAAVVEEVSKAMFATRAKIAAVLLLVGMVAAGAGVIAHGALAARQPAAKQETSKPPAKDANLPRPDREPQPRTDQYGDPLPPEALMRLGTVRFRHGETVGHVAFSPDGKLLASVGQNGETNSNLNYICLWEQATGKLAGGWGETATVWEVATGKLYRRLPGHQYWVSSVSFSPDGKTLATACWDKTIRLWEVLSGKERCRLEGHADRVSAVAFSPDGLRLASGSDDKTVRIWDISTGKALGSFQGHQNVVGRLRFSANGRTLVSGSWDTTILVWDMATLTPERRLDTPKLSPNDLESLWDDLAGEDASKAYQAICTFAAAPIQTARFLQQRIQPATPAGAEHIARLVGDLDNDRVEVRQQATAELEKLGELPLPALRKALAGNPAPEVRRRVEKLVEKLEGPITFPDILRLSRAVEILEQIRTPEAGELLQTLAKGAPEARLTQEAKASLERLAKQPAAR